MLKYTQVRTGQGGSDLVCSFDWHQRVIAPVNEVNRLPDFRELRAQVACCENFQPIIEGGQRGVGVRDGGGFELGQ